MYNKHARGAISEMIASAKLMKEGWNVFSNVAGSGLIDIVAVNPETGEKETVLLQDRIINALAPLFSIDAWLGRDPTYGTPAYGSPTKGYSASGMTEEEVRQANTTEALGEDYIGPTYPSD